jgi:futalosine hydrolase
MNAPALIASTLFECREVVAAFRRKRTMRIAGLTFLSGQLDMHDHPCRVTLCISGIGKTNAARAATLLIARTRPSMIINFGIGGAYKEAGLSLGDIAIADTEHYGDEGLRTGTKFVSMEGLGLPLLMREQTVNYNSFPLLVPERLAREARVGSFVTVSSCTGTAAEGLRMEQQWGALCENMEGAAVAHVGAAHTTPVIELRAISNIIEDRAAIPLSRDHLIQAAEHIQEFFLSMWQQGTFRK